jgi:hypothetical protein
MVQVEACMTCRDFLPPYLLKALLASFEVSYVITKSRKPHTIRENVTVSSIHENVQNYAW